MLEFLTQALYVVWDLQVHSGEFDRCGVTRIKQLMYKLIRILF